MNVLAYIVPKKEVEYLFSDFTVRQALEKMEYHRYSTIPVIDEKTGKYLYSLREGDILWYLKDQKASFDVLTKLDIKDIPRTREIKPVQIDANISDLYELILTQNFVPILDDRGVFMGIVTRQAVLNALLHK